MESYKCEGDDLINFLENTGYNIEREGEKSEIYVVSVEKIKKDKIKWKELPVKIKYFQNVDKMEEYVKNMKNMKDDKYENICIFKDGRNVTWKYTYNTIFINGNIEYLDLGDNSSETLSETSEYSSSNSSSDL